MKAKETVDAMEDYLRYVQVGDGKKEYHALGMAFMKPKAEVYELKKLDEKVRNIFSFSAPLMFLPTVISSAVFNQRANFDKTGF